MNNDILLQILQLDSLIRVLTWKERIMVHLYKSGRAKLTTAKILELHRYIDESKIEIPRMKDTDERLRYFYHKKEKCWFPAEQFGKCFPEIMEQIKNLKN